MGKGSRWEHQNLKTRRLERIKDDITFNSLQMFNARPQKAFTCTMQCHSDGGDVLRCPSPLPYHIKKMAVALRESH
jgi:hypothetical protein